jgi:hypothetical protein
MKSTMRGLITLRIAGAIETTATSGKSRVSL